MNNNMLRFVLILINFFSFAYAQDSTQLGKNAYLPKSHSFVLATGSIRSVFVVRGETHPYYYNTRLHCPDGYRPKEHISLQSTSGNLGFTSAIKGININYRMNWFPNNYQIKLMDAYANPSKSKKQPIWVSWSIYCMA